MHSYDVIGSIGVTAFLVAYTGLQVRKISATSFLYSFLNLVGALAIFYSLFYQWNLSSFVIEVAWILLSAYGLLRYFQRRKVAYILSLSQDN